MKHVLTVILLVGFAASAVKVFVFDGLWPSLSEKKAEVEHSVNNS